MKSKAKFELNELNQAIVQLGISSEQGDVRDKIAQKFKESLGYDGNLALVKFTTPEILPVSGEIITKIDLIPFGGLNGDTTLRYNLHPSFYILEWISETQLKSLMAAIPVELKRRNKIK